MFILFVYFVSMNLAMIKTEENMVRIDVKEGGCAVVTRDVTLVKGGNFSLEVLSDYFIKRSFWDQKLKNSEHTLQELRDSNFSITYERSISPENKIINKFTYKYSHTHKVIGERSGGTWNFRFDLLKHYDPWTTTKDQNQDSDTFICSTSVQINPSSIKYPNNPTGDSDSGSGTGTPGNGISGYTWLIAGVSVFGVLFLVQSSYILYGKARNRRSKKNNDEDPISPKSPKTKRGAKPRKNIADRPPLPLPPDEVVKEDKFTMEPKTSPPMSPVPKRHHIFPQASAPPMPVENGFNYHYAGPLVSKQSYRNKGLVTSDEGVKSPAFVRRPMEGPLVPKPPYRNNSEEKLKSPGLARRQIEGPIVPKPPYRTNSEEKLKSPGLARRQIEAKLAQLPPKAVTASKYFKSPKPLPRSPPPEGAPAFQFAHRKEPSPPLHPKKLPVFPPPAPCRQTDSPRLSDVDWQYEKLEPASKYLNDFSDIPYNNMM